MRGHGIKLSIQRRMVIDLLYFARAVPSVPVQRHISVGELVAARAVCHDRPRWTAIFVKAFALVAEEIPELRRAYVKIPRPHLYEYPTSKATIMIEREYHGEPALCPISVKDPANQPLRAIGELLEHASTVPLENLKGISALETSHPGAATISAAVVVDRPQYRPTARQLLRDIRRVGVLGVQCRVAASAVPADNATQLRRDWQGRPRGGPDHVRPPRDGRCDHRPRSPTHGGNSQLGHTRGGPISAPRCGWSKWPARPKDGGGRWRLARSSDSGLRWPGPTQPEGLTP